MSANEDPSVLREVEAEACSEELARQERDQRDIAIIGINASRLNREAADVLEYQESW